MCPGLNSLASHFIHVPDLPANEGLLSLLVDCLSVLDTMLCGHGQSLLNIDQDSVSWLSVSNNFYF